MSKLELYKSLGFEINWTVIKVGRISHENLPAQLTNEDIINYAKCKSSHSQEERELTLCNKDDSDRIIQLLNVLSQKENINDKATRLEWIAALLNELMQHLSSDYIKGFQQIKNFWDSLNNPLYPLSLVERNKKYIKEEEYYTAYNYEIVKNSHYNWINSMRKKNTYDRPDIDTLLKEGKPYVMAEFIIRSDSKNFSHTIVTEMLGIKPDRFYLYEEFYLPDDKETWTKHVKNSWCIQTKYEQVYDCAIQINKLIDRLNGKENVIKQICKDYDAEVIIGVVPKIYGDNFPVMDLTKEMIDYFHNLNAYYSIDPYYYCE